MKPSEALRQAKQVLVERGWCKDTLENEAGACCAVGAINAVERGNPLSEADLDGSRLPCDARMYLFRTVNRAIPLWNDSPARTLDDVLQAFDRAAVLAESEGN